MAPTSTCPIRALVRCRPRSASRSAAVSPSSGRGPCIVLALVPLVVVAGAALQGSGCAQKTTQPTSVQVRAVTTVDVATAPASASTPAPAPAPTVTIADVADPERDLAEVEVISKTIKATTKGGICRALLSFDFAAVTPYLTEDAVIEPLFPFDEQLFADNARLRAALVRTRAAGPAGDRRQLESDLRRLASSWSRVERCFFAPYMVFSTRGENRRAKVVLHLWLGGAEASGARVSDRGDVTAEMIEGKDGRWRISRMRYSERERVVTRSPGFADWTRRARLPSEWPDIGYRRDLTSGQVLYGGIATGDYDGDGWTDIYLSRAGQNALLHNDGHGGFEDVTRQAGAALPGNGQSALFVDLDNDGDKDLVVVYAHYTVVTGPATNRRSVAVFTNDGKGKFSLQAELGPVGPASGISAADYDGDGLVDFYVTYYQDEALFPYHHHIEAQDGFGNHLFHNLGGLRFEDVTSSAGVGGHGWSYASAFADYDEDGKIDLYVANDFGDNYLFRNLGGGTFAEVARDAQALNPANGMSVDWGDYNNDGLLDIYVSNMYSKTGREYLALDQTLDETLRKKLLFAVTGNSFYRNVGAGKFEEASRPLAVNLAGWAWGANFLDHDNDGWQDLYVANGFWEGDVEDDA
jgi:hypothetical protein